MRFHTLIVPVVSLVPRSTTGYFLLSLRDREMMSCYGGRRGLPAGNRQHGFHATSFCIEHLRFRDAESIGLWFGD